MIINFVYNDVLRSVILPEKVTGQFWFENPEGKKVFRIEGINSKWIIRTTSRFMIREKSDTDDWSLQSAYEVFPKQLYFIRKADGQKERIYVFTEEYTPDRIEFGLYKVPSEYDISIGNGTVAKIVSYHNEYVSAEHADLIYSENRWMLKAEGGRNGTFVNGRMVTEANLNYGDMIFIMGLKIVVGRNCFSINNPDGKVSIHSKDLPPIEFPQLQFEEDEDPDEETIKEVFFDRSPRFKRDIKEADMVIDPPPRENQQDEMPAILTVGPSMTMAMASVTTGVVAVSNAISTGDMRTAVPTIVMSGSMCLGMLLWPTLTRRYSKKQKEKKEHIRQTKYKEYLENKKIEIQAVCDEQAAILKENIVTTGECERRIVEIGRDLWERASGHNDFLSVRIGTGDLPMFGKLQYNPRRFSLSDDNLENMMFELCESPKILKDVPITVSLADQSIGILGAKDIMYPFVVGIIIQLSALFSYDELKLMVLYDPADEERFGFVKWLPHIWSEDRNCRFVATNAEEVKVMSSYLETVFSYREHLNDSELEDEKTSYVILALSKDLFNRSEILRSILSSKKKHHISVLSAFTELRHLPKECAKVIELDAETGRLYDNNDTSGNVITFRPDIKTRTSALTLSKKLANIKLDDTDGSAKLPKMLTFMQMMGVGKLSHLNPLLRWKENDPTKTLAVPVGVNPYGDLFMLDLHEKFHGPHGLVAGMTGSGKSEFIITYILSLAINFHPHEVSFIMIDYKGGGMAKSFENLPHTAGIITNLDGSAIKRSLVSINSELKRRQAMLTEAGKIVGESNLNIYQYQQLYRQGVVSEPLSHLFIIADEFAELKTQQSEFMTELISAARIGRSLGVHLILATQKPSGVVDDQIWSNSRFRVCLKVQERQDSMDMLKRPDAAELAETGRFYLQVGYNEMFEMGQSSWAGAEYHPSDRVIEEKDNSVEAIDLTGRVIRSIKPKAAVRSFEKPRKQLDVITEYLEKIAREEGVCARPLWLASIPEIICVSDLERKYPAESSRANVRYQLEPVIGEYDDPAAQKQGLLTLPLTAEGNTIIYGAPGSGKTTLLNTIISSIILKHTPDEVNLYIFDFSDETLKSYEKAPHVGEVMVSSDNEKISRFFKMMYKQIKLRKKKLSASGTDHSGYVKKYGDAAQMPAIVVVMQNYTAFSELYGDNDDDILYLTREGTKYGIYFIMTTLAANGIRYRIIQNFKQHLVLQQNDDSEYSSILGKTDGLFPAKIKGRGLVKTDKLVEFQTARISKEKSPFDCAVELSARLRARWKGKHAERIPVLPDSVDAEFLSSELNKGYPLILPVGVNKNTLYPQMFDFSQHTATLVLSLDKEYLSFIGEFVTLLQMTEGVNFSIIDPQNAIGLDAAQLSMHRIELFTGKTACADAVGEMFSEMVMRNNTFKDALENGSKQPEFSLRFCLIVSLSSLIDGLDDDKKERLQLLLEKNEKEYNFFFLISDNKKGAASYSYSQWFKKNISTTDGIWVGAGANDQYVIEAPKNQEFRQKTAIPFGFVVEKGEAKHCKLLWEGEISDDN